LNYAYADCDGDGDVDDDDKTIIENNFGSVQGAVIPDVYATGDPGLDPILQLSTGMSSVPPRGTLDANLSLGVETDSLSDFYGIAFTVAYDPNVVGKQGNAFQLDILENTWMNGTGNDKVIKFLNNDRDNGIVQIAIVRKNQVPVSGFGDIGTVSIVMEDIVVGLSNIAISDIKTVDLNLTDFMVAPSDLDFTIDSTLTPTVQLIRRKGVKLYPNPVIGDKVTIELDNPTEIIRQVQLFDSTGRLLQSQDVGSQAESYGIDVNPYASGIYTLKIFTNKHIYVQSFFR
jgi:hypothetical protein